MTEVSYYNTVGRRKTAIARVRLALGKGELKVNRENLDKYFPDENLIRVINKPLLLTDNQNKYDISAILNGGGLSGQADAMCLGIARALIKVDPQLRGVLKKAGLLTRDSRQKERKKYGQPGARKRFQFSKR